MASEGVSVVVLTHNRMEEVARTVSRMRALQGVREVIVVDNASSDGTCSYLRAYQPGVPVVRLSRNLGAAARNVGVRIAASRYVALCDDDTWWAPGCLERAAALLDAHPRVAVLTARVIVEPEGRVDPTSLRMAASPLESARLPGAAVLGFLAGACLFRRDAFLQVGGFAPRFFIGGEEALMALDLAARGWQMLYRDDVIVHHHPSAKRDSAERRRLLLCNAIYLALLRLPPSSAALEIAQALYKSLRERCLIRLVREVVSALPALWNERQVIPAGVESARRTVRRHEAHALPASLQPARPASR